MSFDYKGHHLKVCLKFFYRNKCKPPRKNENEAFMNAGMRVVDQSENKELELSINYFFPEQIMNAAWYTETGPAEVLQIGELPTPEPKPGEVLVRLYAHGVNPTDCKRRAGLRGAVPNQPVVPGYDGAGMIAAVGDGVDQGRVGERVWVWEAFHNKWQGTAAEFVCVGHSRAMPLPNGVSFEQGACLGVPAITACHSVLISEPQDGDTLLVTGAAGMVCNYAVQLAKRMGLRVIAAVRGGTCKEQAAAGAGADHVINTDRDDLAETVLELTNGKGVNAFIDVDLGAHLHFASRITAINGTIVSFGTATNPRPTLDWMAFAQRNIRLSGVAIFSVPEPRKHAAAAFVQEELISGNLIHRIDSRWPLDKIADAHKRQEQGRPIGKIIVTL